MKKSFYILTAAMLSFTLTSCENEFLEKQPNEELSPEQVAAAVAKDPSLLMGSIAGLYATMYDTGTGGISDDNLDHDDFGQKGYDIYSDMLTSDVAVAGLNYGWYETLVRHQSTKDFTRIDAYKPWRYYYRLILGANTVIDALGGTDAKQIEPINRLIMGQAKAVRAYAYFYLAQFYATGYGTGSEKILPIYTSTKVPNQPKSTSAEVYNLIISDLDDALVNLQGFKRKSKDQIDQSVVKGLLAYALAARGATPDLNRVVTLTDEVIATGGYRLMTSTELVANVDPETGTVTNSQAGFNNVANPSWMWGVDLTIANELDIVSWWGQMDIFTYSYTWAGDPKVIDKGLYDAIRKDDIRKGQFDPIGGGIEKFYKGDGYTEGSFDLMPVNKFFDPSRIPGGQRTVITDYVYMRLEEMYLLNAEAKAKLGQDGPARDRLKEVLASRIPNLSYLDALSGKALQDEIYLQTRIELWGEGKAYLAMKRNKATVTRGENHLFEAGKSFAWDSDELTFPIPQAEILNNPVLNN